MCKCLRQDRSKINLCHLIKSWPNNSTICSVRSAACWVAGRNSLFRVYLAKWQNNTKIAVLIASFCDLELVLTDLNDILTLPLFHRHPRGSCRPLPPRQALTSPRGPQHLVRSGITVSRCFIRLAPCCRWSIILDKQGNRLIVIQLALYQTTKFYICPNWKHL